MLIEEINNKLSTVDINKFCIDDEQLELRKVSIGFSRQSKKDVKFSRWRRQVFEDKVIENENFEDKDVLSNILLYGVIGKDMADDFAEIREICNKYKYYVDVLVKDKQNMDKTDKYLGIRIQGYGQRAI